MFSHRIVVSPITYSEMRLDAILSWDRAAVDGTTDIKMALRQAGTPIGQNDTAIAGPEAGRPGKLTSPTL